jgi:hypothetical protein
MACIDAAFISHLAHKTAQVRLIESSRLGNAACWTRRCCNCHQQAMLGGVVHAVEQAVPPLYNAA